MQPRRPAGNCGRQAQTDPGAEPGAESELSPGIPADADPTARRPPCQFLVADRRTPHNTFQTFTARAAAAGSRTTVTVSRALQSYRRALPQGFPPSLGRPLWTGSPRTRGPWLQDLIGEKGGVLLVRIGLATARAVVRRAGPRRACCTVQDKPRIGGCAAFPRSGVQARS